MQTTRFTIRLGLPQDSALLAALGAQTFSDSFAADNTPEDMAAYLAANFSPQKQAQELADPQTIFLIVEADGQAAGYARLRLGAQPEDLGGQTPVEIVRFYAHQSWIGRGVGAALMQACLEQAESLGCDRIWLDVWEKNPRAIAFYTKWGFEKVGEQAFVLGEDVQRDWLMARGVVSTAA